MDIQKSLLCLKSVNSQAKRHEPQAKGGRLTIVQKDFIANKTTRTINSHNMIEALIEVVHFKALDTFLYQYDT